MLLTLLSMLAVGVLLVLLHFEFNRKTGWNQTNLPRTRRKTEYSRSSRRREKKSKPIDPGEWSTSLGESDSENEQNGARRSSQTDLQFDLSEFNVKAGKRAVIVESSVDSEDGARWIVQNKGCRVDSAKRSNDETNTHVQNNLRNSPTTTNVLFSRKQSARTQSTQPRQPTNCVPSKSGEMAQRMRSESSFGSFEQSRVWVRTNALKRSIGPRDTTSTQSIMPSDDARHDQLFSRRQRGPPDNFGTAQAGRQSVSSCLSNHDNLAQITVALMVRCSVLPCQTFTMRVASAYQGLYDFEKSLPMRRSIVDPCLWVLTLRVPQYIYGSEFVYKYFAWDSCSRAVFQEPGEPRRIYLGDKDTALGVEQEDAFAVAVPILA